MLISESYKKELEELHKINEDWGTGPKISVIGICHWMYMNNIKRVLDYGCGKGRLSLFLPIEVSNYDPGIPEWCVNPKPEDYLLCTDVLEHVEPDYIENVIEHLVSKFKKKAYLIIALGPSRVILPSGRNAHLIIKSAEWWIKLVKKYAFIEHIEFSTDERTLDSAYDTQTVRCETQTIGTIALTLRKLK